MKTIHKMACRILLGSGFLYPAYQMHQEAHALSDKAAGVKPTITLEQQIENDARPKLPDELLRQIRRANPEITKKAMEYFGSDEHDAEIERAGRPLLNLAILLDQKAAQCALPGFALIGWGLWAFIGPFVRALLPEPKREEPKPCDASASS